MFYTIYKTTNKINGKIYIGMHQTINLNDSYLGSGLLLGHAIKKYGKENFKKEYLFIYDTYEEMHTKEIEIVTVDFCLREDTYNLGPGGKGGIIWITNPMLGKNNRKNKNQLLENLLLKKD